MVDAEVFASFRDPSGFVFLHDGTIYRQVNTLYKDDYDRLVASGLYRRLVDAGLLIPHKEVDLACALSQQAYKLLQPEPVPFISYPYEWSFSQLKHAAATTLTVQRTALEFGMSLKDACAYNIQFIKGKPVLIDTLSFEIYREGTPWGAYKQFCEHFLAPLALMSRRDVRLNQLLRVYLDGIPLDLAASILPTRAWLDLRLLLHIRLHARSQRRYADSPAAPTTLRQRVARTALLGLVDSLQSSINKLTWRPTHTSWAHYYTNPDAYSPTAMDHKKQLVGEFLDRVKPKTLWDLGANTGVFSRIASDKGINTISFDMDPACVEINYLTALDRGDANLLPLVLDLTNPSPGIGWENRERMSLLDRPRPDAVLALALLHHLAIANNLPLARIAGFLSRICRSLIIEFIPKTDKNVRRLLATRQDIFPTYTEEAFQDEFARVFSIESSVRIHDSDRTLYLMKARRA